MDIERAKREKSKTQTNKEVTTKNAREMEQKPETFQIEPHKASAISANHVVGGR